MFSIKKEAELEPGSPFQIFKTLFSSVVRAVQGCLLLFSILGKNNKGTKATKTQLKNDQIIKRDGQQANKPNSSVRMGTVRITVKKFTN